MVVLVKVSTSEATIIFVTYIDGHMPVITTVFEPVMALSIGI